MSQHQSRHLTKKTLGKLQYLQNICELKRFMINTHQFLSGICSCLLISFLCKLFLETEHRELLWDSYRAKLGGPLNEFRKEKRVIVKHHIVDLHNPLS